MIPITMFCDRGPDCNNRVNAFANVSDIGRDVSDTRTLFSVAS